MSQKEKLIKRIRSNPKDFTYEELCHLMKLLGFEEDNGGRTSGSRTRFVKGKDKLEIHKPHPQNVIKPCTLKMINCYLDYLESEGDLL